jgi:hypothetical protein
MNMFRLRGVSSISSLNMNENVVSCVYNNFVIIKETIPEHVGKLLPTCELFRTRGKEDCPEAQKERGTKVACLSLDRQRPLSQKLNVNLKPGTKADNGT